MTPVATDLSVLPGSETGHWQISCQVACPNLVKFERQADTGHTGSKTDRTVKKPSPDLHRCHVASAIAARLSPHALLGCTKSSRLGTLFAGQRGNAAIGHAT